MDKDIVSDKFFKIDDFFFLHIFTKLVNTCFKCLNKRRNKSVDIELI